ncbi:MAG: hypothetical protein A2X13_15035 [Bacteroidetes bacterium GWC2_33_15]|nr:MAG: hypothetical protein A2X10_07100 [Bacteroidetes bacterium GWA2_33_15]OFX50184.1 MAG: hypothetical protein A2X13_15035 [Bacteroidetes bacterium GWC2_33_15]OFX65336.1 MAG: hypothetical protein A2X15_04610 [Bacteroidetes bacterium GWB2_32_14]OFX70563.1 MAG: hypothetical protein A2X14_04665 [Bacteroidetes bacterium GWD2_33_33]
MEQSEKYDNFPLWIVLLSNLLSLSICGLGFAIMFRLGWIAAIIYLAYILVLEYRLVKNHCTNCFYWGKICGFGNGKISSWFFKKGDISQFCLHEMTWNEMIPDMLVSLIPFVTGIVLLIIHFDIKYLIGVILLIVLSTFGNGFIRGNFACKYCRQKEMGCPVDKLFNKGK